MRRGGPVTKVAVYGLSTEGYGLARRMAVGGAQVSVIDESAHMAMALEAEAASKYPDIPSLKEDEPLMPMMPADLAISGAEYLFFAPVVRMHSSISDIDSHPAFKAAVSAVKKNHSFVHLLPVGFGDNGENISIMERLTGLSAGRSAGYYYCPIFGRAPPVVGSHGGRPDEALAGLMADGGRPGFVTIPSAEGLHTLEMVARFAKISAVIETAHNVREDMGAGDLDRFRDMFLDDMVGGMYDLRALRAASAPPGTMTYVVNGSLRTVDAYLRRLLRAVRSLLREPEFKARRVRVAVMWTHDAHEMRSDRRSMLHVLLSRLRDHLGDVDMLEDAGMFHSDEALVVIPCSRPDYERISATKEPGTAIVKANPLCEIER